MEHVLRGVSLDPLALRSALATIPSAAWSLPSTFTATRVHHGYRRVVMVDAGRQLPESEPFAFVLDHFAPVHEAWLSWIDPGGFIVPHRDKGPYRERWQVPIRPAGTFTQGDEFEPQPGRCFPVAHWEPHAVMNDTPQQRVHLVIDRAVLAPVASAAFATFPIPTHMEDLVCRALRT